VRSWALGKHVCYSVCVGKHSNFSFRTEYLALILLTLHQLPAPEESLFEARPILTPVYLRNFWTLDALEAKVNVYGDRNAIDGISSFPTLAALVSHQLRTDYNTSSFRKGQDIMSSFPFWQEVRRNVPFYLHTAGTDKLVPGRNLKSRYLSPPQRTFLSTATLVIVPPHLFIQWQSEIHKHCEDTLRTLTLKHGDKMPIPEDLANEFDIVLLSAKRKISKNCDEEKQSYCSSRILG
jgi:SNF2-related domain